MKKSKHDSKINYIEKEKIIVFFIIKWFTRTIK